MNAEQLHLGAGRTTLVQMIALLDQQFLAAIGSPASNRAWWIFLAGFLATVAVSLLVLSWTRWGQSKVLTKCAAIAVLAHIWLLLYAYSTQINMGGSGSGSPEGNSYRGTIAWLPVTPEMESEQEGTVERGLTGAGIGDAEPSLTDAANEDAANESEKIDRQEPDPTIDVAEANTPFEMNLEALLSSMRPTNEAPIDLPPDYDPTADFNQQLMDQMEADRATPNVSVTDHDSETNKELQGPPRTADELESSDLPATEIKSLQNQTVTNLASQVTADPSPKIKRSLATVPPTYRMRFAPDRLGFALQNGGDEQTEAAVGRALAYLAKSQSADGSWNARAHGAGEYPVVRTGEGVYRGDTGKFADTAMTGLALLAFLGAGHTHIDNGAYSETVRKGLEYLLAQQFPSGDLSGRGQVGQEATVRYSRMYSHGIAGIALAEAYALTHDPRLVEPVRAAAGHTAKAMNPRTGGWRYDFGVDDPGDTSQFGWQAMLLNSAHSGDVVPLQGSQRIAMQRFLDSVSTGRSGGLAVYRNLNPSQRAPVEQATAAMTAEAFAMRALLGFPMSTQASEEARRMLLTNLPSTGEINFYYWYYATLALYQTKDQLEIIAPGSRVPSPQVAWSTWNESMKRTLLSSQRSDGEVEGSWDPRCVWGNHGGRIYTTALGCMCLEVYYRYLPMYQEAELAKKASPGDDRLPSTLQR